LDTRSLPIRQYLIDKVLPTITEGLILYTDKVDFSKISDDQNDKTEIGEDPLDFLIAHLEKKGNEIEEKIAEFKRLQEEARLKALKKNDHSQTGDSDDYSSTPEDTSNMSHLKP
jgi:hypothetical protein